MRLGRSGWEVEVVPTLVAALLLALLLGLGRWQLERAAEKSALLAALAAAAAAPAVELSPEAARFARVRARGEWDAAHQFLLDAQPHAGRTGFRVLTPLTLADGTRLIVDRGWVAADLDRRRLPPVALAARAVAVEGLLDEFPRAGLRAAPAPAASGAWPRTVLYPTAAELGAALGAPVHSRLLRLAPAAPDGFARDATPSLGFGPERHQGYALTWFALAATLVVLWARLAVRRP